jgi:hypothetical protein
MATVPVSFTAVIQHGCEADMCYGLIQLEMSTLLMGHSVVVLSCRLFYDTVSTYTTPSIMEDEMGKACSNHRREEECMYNFGGKIQKGRDFLRGSGSGMGSTQPREDK